MGSGRGGAGGVGGARERRPQETGERAANTLHKYDGPAGAAPDASIGGAPLDASDGAIKGEHGEESNPLLAALDKSITTVYKDINSALRKIGSKESEKFDLIFAILSELQSRQAKLEETVRTLQEQYSGAGNAAASCSSGGVAVAGGDEHPAFNSCRRMPGMPMNCCVIPADCTGPQGSCSPMGPVQVQFVPQVVAVAAGPNGMMPGMQYAIVSPAGPGKQMMAGHIMPISEMPCAFWPTSPPEAEGAVLCEGRAC